MNYWNARAALKRVVAFRDAYFDYAQARSDCSWQAAWGAQQRMATLAGAVAYDLHRARQAPLILVDAPARGRRTRLMSLAAVSLDSKTADRHHVRPGMLITMWQVAIGQYERIVRREYWKLFNPAWWLAQAVGLIVRLPFYILGAVGFDQSRAEGSIAGRGYKLVMSTLGFIAVPITILSHMKNLGWLDAMANTLSHLTGQ